MPTSWNNRTKPITDWSARLVYLIQEALGYILQEDGGKIIVSGATGANNIWVNHTKP